MKLRVNPAVGIWGVSSKENPAFKLWFTLADKAPQDIDLEKLPKDLQDSIVAALNARKLLQIQNGVEIVPVVPEFSGAAQGLTIPMRQRARKVLDCGVSTIKREISVVDDAVLLSGMLSMERVGKKRKTVISLLEKQLAKSSSFGRTDARLGNVYANLIVDEEETTTKVQVDK